MMSTCQEQLELPSCFSKSWLVFPVPPLVRIFQKKKKKSLSNQHVVFIYGHNLVRPLLFYHFIPFSSLIVRHLFFKKKIVQHADAGSSSCVDKKKLHSIAVAKVQQRESASIFLGWCLPNSLLVVCNDESLCMVAS